jgi:hypothetical protein
VGFREPANQLEQRRVRHDVGEYFRVARAVPSKRKTSSSAIAFMTPAKLIPGRSGSKRAAVRARHRAGCCPRTRSAVLDPPFSDVGVVQPSGSPSQAPVCAGARSRAVSEA